MIDPAALPAFDAVARAGVVVLLVLLPWLATRGLPDAEEAELLAARRSELYLVTALSLATLALLTWGLAVWRALPPAGIGWRAGPAVELAVWSVGTTAAGLAAVWLLTRAGRALGAEESPLVRILLPRTPRQRWSFVAVAAVAGVAEEYVFRGFLLHGLAGWTGSVWAAVLLSAASFGVGHGYQRAVGVARASVLGVLLAVPVVFTGSLFPAAVAHFWINVAIGLGGWRWLLPPGEVGEEGESRIVLPRERGEEPPEEPGTGWKRTLIPARVAAGAVAVALLAAAPSAAAQEGAAGGAGGDEGDRGPEFGLVLESGFRAEPEGAARSTGFELFRARARVSGRAGIGFEYRARAAYDPERRVVDLLDARVLVPLWPGARLSAGQFRAPFSREMLRDRGGIQFAERAQAVEALAPGRQVGVELSGHLLDRRLSYRTGLFNGEGRRAGNPDGGYLYAARLGFSRLGGEVSFYDELAVNGGVGFAASADSGRDYSRAGSFLSPWVDARDFEGDRIAWGADVEVSYRSVFLAGEYLWSRFDPDLPASAPPGALPAGEEPPARTVRGLYLEGGYRLWGGLVDLLARYDAFEPVDGETRDFFVMGANVYPGFDARVGFQYALGPESLPPPPPGTPARGLERSFPPGGLADGQFITRLQLSF